MRKIILLTICAIASTFSFAQVKKGAPIEIDATSCPRPAGFENSARFNVYGYYYGYNQADHCQKVLVVVTATDNNGTEYTVAYGVVCIPDAVKGLKIEEPKLNEALTTCAREMLVKEVNEKFKK